jgi:hypothetical protein
LDVIKSLRRVVPQIERHDRDYAAIAWGWLQDASESLRHLDRLLALLWRLTHPRP